mgnify:CR=1 FL=1
MTFFFTKGFFPFGLGFSSETSTSATVARSATARRTDFAFERLTPKRACVVVIAEGAGARRQRRRATDGGATCRDKSTKRWRKKRKARRARIPRLRRTRALRRATSRTRTWTLGATVAMADVADIARIRSDGVRVARVWSVARVERGGCETNSLLSSVAALSLALRAGRSTRRLRRTERCFVRDVSQTRGRKTTRTPRGRSRDDTWSPVALGRSDLECPLDARAPRAAPQRRASIPHVSSWCSFITTTPRTTPRRRARCVFARRPTTRLARRAPASARAAPRSPPRFRDRIVIGPSDADARLPPSLPPSLPPVPRSAASSAASSATSPPSAASRRARRSSASPRDARSRARRRLPPSRRRASRRRRRRPTPRSRPSRPSRSRARTTRCVTARVSRR